MIEQVAAWATTLGVPIGLFGVGIALQQTRLARKTAAAGLALSSYEAFRTAWERYDHAEGQFAVRTAFNDILNLIEANCAIVRDGLLVGHAGDTLENYLANTLVQIDQSDAAVELVGELMETSDTFSDIRWFLQSRQAKTGDFVARLQKFASPSAI